MTWIMVLTILGASPVQMPFHYASEADCTRAGIAAQSSSLGGHLPEGRGTYPVVPVGFMCVGGPLK